MQREPSDDRLIPLLAAVRAGEPGASEKLADAVHEDLRAMARRRLEKNFGKNLGGITIQPTMLANDTLLRLLRQRSAYDNAGHLFAVASRLMMRILVDYCRQRKAAKRGGDAVRVSLDPEQAAPAAEVDETPPTADVESLDAALDRLAALDARKADVVRYRILWGFTVAETADALGVAAVTVERDWVFAKTWLAKELRP